MEWNGRGEIPSLYRACDGFFFPVRPWPFIAAYSVSSGSSSSPSSAIVRLGCPRLPLPPPPLPVGAGTREGVEGSIKSSVRGWTKEASAGRGPPPPPPPCVLVSVEAPVVPAAAL